MLSEQPFSDDETIRGAINRANGALEKGNGDIGIGLEGGVQETEHGLLLCNWGALVSIETEPIIAGGARFLLPEAIAGRLRAGEELGPVMEDYAKKENVRKTGRGSWNIYQWFNKQSRNVRTYHEPFNRTILLQKSYRKIS